VPAAATLQIYAAKFSRGGGELRLGRHVAIRSDRKASRFEPIFLRATILHDIEDLGTRADRYVARRGFETGNRDLFDLQRDHVAVSREVRGSTCVSERRGEAPVGD